MNTSLWRVSGAEGSGTIGLSLRLRALRVVAVLACLLLPLSTANAAAGRIADGRYGCTLSFMTVLGHIEIKDQRYRTIAKNGSSSDLYPLAVEDTGAMRLDGPVSLLSQNGLVLAGARMVAPQRSEFGFTLTVQTASGAFHSVFCTTG